MNEKPTVDFAINLLKDHVGEITVSGHCGIGAAIENFIGIKPNCSDSSDLTTHELKSTSGNCDITLFTKSPEKGDTYDIVLKYGYNDKKNRKSYTKDIKSTTSELFCRADEYGIGIYDFVTRQEICYWSHDHCKSGYEKISNILKVSAKKNKINQGSYAVTDISAFENFRLASFIELINIGAISISPRRYFKSTVKNTITGRYPSRDRGCAFRVNKKYLNELYDKQISH